MAFWPFYDRNIYSFLLNKMIFLLSNSTVTIFYEIVTKSETVENILPTIFVS